MKKFLIIINGILIITVFSVSCWLITIQPQANILVSSTLNINLYGLLIANSIFAFLSVISLLFNTKISVVLKLLDLTTWVTIIAIHSGIQSISSLTTLIINTVASGILRKYLYSEEPLLVFLNTVLIWSSFSTIIIELISKNFDPLQEATVILGFLAIIAELWVRNVISICSKKKERSHTDIYDSLFYSIPRILIVISLDKNL